MTVDPATVRKAAETLLAKHGLTDWSFEWDNTLGRSGQTRYTRKTITYSIHYLGSPPHSIVNTLLHEISHALVGPGHGHDEHWRKTAISIGCTGERCGADRVAPASRYTIKCRKCSNEWKRHRLNPRLNIGKCQCGGHLTIIDNRNEVTG